MNVTRILSILTILWSGAEMTAEQWIQLAPGGAAPTSLSGNAVVYSAASNRLIVFGGSFSGQQSNRLFHLTHANGLGGTPLWIETPTNGPWPTPRGGHKAVYDSANDRMIVWGGYSLPGFVLLNDTWVLSNASAAFGTPQWSQLAPSGTLPNGAISVGLAYDGLNNRLILMGGLRNNVFLSDTYVLSNANGLGGAPSWELLSPTGPLPPPRASHQIHFDAGNNRLIVFGGGAYGLNQNDTWLLLNANGLGGIPQWVQLTPSTPTLQRYNFASGYRASSNQLTVAVGVTNTPGVLSNDAWRLSVANGLGAPAWTQIFPSGPVPPPRDSVTQAGYDEANGRLIFAGGTDSTGAELHDVWVLAEDPVDSTPPVITPTVTGSLGANNWYTSNVTVTWNASDPESAVTSSSGCDATTISADTPSLTLTCSATSTGGTASQSVTIQRDAMPPAVNVTGVANGGAYSLGSVPAPGCNTTDSSSGVATNALSSVTGGNATGVGSFTATCAGATDNAGNTATAVSVTYTVQYNFLGFLPPVNMGIWNSMKAGQSVPMKWQLPNDSNGYISALSVVQLITSANVACTAGTLGLIETADSSGASGLHYDAASNQYIFSWKTDKSWAGTCRRFFLQLDDGSTKTANFQLR